MDRKLSKIVNGGLTRTDCRILNRYRDKKKDSFKAYDLVSPLLLNRTHMEPLLKFGLVTEGSGYNQFGRPPTIYTLTTMGKQVIEYMSTNDIVVRPS